MKPKYMYQWKHLDGETDPPWLVAIAGFLWALVVVFSMFI